MRHLLVIPAPRMDARARCLRSLKSTNTLKPHRRSPRSRSAGVDWRRIEPVRFHGRGCDERPGPTGVIVLASTIGPKGSARCRRTVPEHQRSSRDDEQALFRLARLGSAVVRPSLSSRRTGAAHVGSTARARRRRRALVRGRRARHAWKPCFATSTWATARRPGENSTREDGSALRLLEFTGRSAPDRAARLNRFGFIQELSRGGAAIHFGLMTSSRKESAAEAKAELRSQSKDARYSAIDGRTHAGGIETANARFQAPAWTSIEGRQQLIGQARQALSAATRSTTVAQGSPLSFLHALARLLNNAQGNATQHAYNGGLYGLKVERSRDPNAKGIMKVNGKLRRLEGGSGRVPPVDGRGRVALPLRIEY